MTSRKYHWLAMVGILAIALVGDTSLAARGGGARGGGGGGFRGGGGGYRGGGGGGYRGGGYSRPSYSGGGSIRYASPRPAAPSYARPSAPSYYRPSAPVAAPRPSGGSLARPYASSYRPANNGSIIHHGTVTTPGGSTIGWVNPPGRGGAVGIKGADGGTAGAIRGPGGAGAAGIKGPEGGTAGAIRGPGGGGAARVVGPGGGTAGAIRGPGGAGAAGIRGAGGSSAGAVWGPEGRGVAGVQGPHGNRYVTTLPGGAIHYPWHGHDYWHVGFGWWSPYWVGDSMYYGWAYPPIGYYYPTLPENYETVVINNTTYYESDGVYYQEGEQDGKKGYVVAETPEGVAGGEPEGENPFKILKSMCDYIAGLEKFSAVAETTTDEVWANGEKVQVMARRVVYVNRPDKLAIEVTGDKGAKRVVYDGKTVSMLDRTQNLYTDIQVPNTIDAALDTLARDYGIVIPLEDFLYKNLYERIEPRISAGQYLGLHMLDSLKCHHLAFSTDKASFEIWVDAGEKPVPRKITIDYGKDAARSRYSAEILGWAESPRFKAGTFQFVTPTGVRRVEIAPISTSATTREADSR